MTPAQALAEHRREPTRKTAARIIHMLHEVEREVMAQHPLKSLPHWLSQPSLRTYVEDAMRSAVNRLAYLPIAENDVADYVKQEIEDEIAPLFVRAKNDALNRRRFGVGAFRWGEESFRTRDGKVQRHFDVEDSYQPRDQHDQHEMDQCRVAQMFKSANTEKKRLTLSLLVDGAPIQEIRIKTKLRKPDVARVLSELFSKST